MWTQMRDRTGSYGWVDAVLCVALCIAVLPADVMAAPARTEVALLAPGEASDATLVVRGTVAITWDGAEAEGSYDVRYTRGEEDAVRLGSPTLDADAATLEHDWETTNDDGQPTGLYPDGLYRLFVTPKGEPGTELAAADVVLDNVAPAIIGVPDRPLVVNLVAGPAVRLTLRVQGQSADDQFQWNVVPELSWTGLLAASFGGLGQAEGTLSLTPLNVELPGRDVAVKVEVIDLNVVDTLGANNSSTTSIAVDVNGVPQVSSAMPAVVPVAVGETQTIDVAAWFTDDDDESIEIAASSDTGHVDVAVAEGKLTLVANSVGVTTVELTADDGDYTSVARLIVYTHEPFLDSAPLLVLLRPAEGEDTIIAHLTNEVPVVDLVWYVLGGPIDPTHQVRFAARGEDGTPQPFDFFSYTDRKAQGQFPPGVPEGPVNLEIQLRDAGGNVFGEAVPFRVVLDYDPPLLDNQGPVDDLPLSGPAMQVGLDSLFGFTENPLQHWRLVGASPTGIVDVEIQEIQGSHMLVVTPLRVTTAPSQRGIPLTDSRQLRGEAVVVVEAADYVGGATAEAAIPLTVVNELPRLTSLQTATLWARTPIANRWVGSTLVLDAVAGVGSTTGWISLRDIAVDDDGDRVDWSADPESTSLLQIDVDEANQRVQFIVKPEAALSATPQPVRLVAADQTQEGVRVPIWVEAALSFNVRFNRSPTATDRGGELHTLTVAENPDHLVSRDLSLLAEDPDGDSLIWEIVRGGSKDSVSASLEPEESSLAAFTFAPQWWGEETFLFKATDPWGLEVEVDLDVLVGRVDDPLVASGVPREMVGTVGQSMDVDVSSYYTDPEDIGPFWRPRVSDDVLRWLDVTSGVGQTASVFIREAHPDGVIVLEFDVDDDEDLDEDADDPTPPVLLELRLTTNRSPSLVSEQEELDPVEFDENDPAWPSYSLADRIEDPDGDSWRVEVDSVSDGAPFGARVEGLTPATYTLIWTREGTDRWGPATVRLKATDIGPTGASRGDPVYFALDVNVREQNDPPVILVNPTPPGLAIPEGKQAFDRVLTLGQPSRKTFDLPAHVVDPDADDPGIVDPLVWTVSQLGADPEETHPTATVDGDSLIIDVAEDVTAGVSIVLTVEDREVSTGVSLTLVVDVAGKLSFDQPVIINERADDVGTPDPVSVNLQDHVVDDDATDSVDTWFEPELDEAAARILESATVTPAGVLRIIPKVRAHGTGGIRILGRDGPTEDEDVTANIDATLTVTVTEIAEAPRWLLNEELHVELVEHAEGAPVEDIWRRWPLDDVLWDDDLTPLELYGNAMDPISIVYTENGPPPGQEYLRASVETVDEIPYLVVGPADDDTARDANDYSATVTVAVQDSTTDSAGNPAPLGVVGTFRVSVSPTPEPPRFLGVTANGRIEYAFAEKLSLAYDDAAMDPLTYVIPWSEIVRDDEDGLDDLILLVASPGDMVAVSDAKDQVIRVTPPDGDWNLDATLSLRVTDAEDLSSPPDQRPGQELWIDVTPSPEGPRPTELAVSPFALSEDEETRVFSLDELATDDDSKPTELVWAVGTQVGVVAKVDVEAGKLSVTPVEDYYGSASAVFTVSDADTTPNASVITLHIPISPVPDPISVDLADVDPVTFKEGGRSAPVPLSGAVDPDGQPLVWRVITTNPPELTVEITAPAGGDLSKPEEAIFSSTAGDWSGEGTVTFRVSANLAELANAPVAAADLLNQDDVVGLLESHAVAPNRVAVEEDEEGVRWILKGAPVPLDIVAVPADDGPTVYSVRRYAEASIGVVVEDANDAPQVSDVVVHDSDQHFGVREITFRVKDSDFGKYDVDRHLTVSATYTVNDSETPDDTDTKADPATPDAPRAAFAEAGEIRCLLRDETGPGIRDLPADAAVVDEVKGDGHTFSVFWYSAVAELTDAVKDVDLYIVVADDSELRSVHSPVSIALDNRNRATPQVRGVRVPGSETAIPDVHTGEVEVAVDFEDGLTTEQVSLRVELKKTTDDEYVPAVVRKPGDPPDANGEVQAVDVGAGSAPEERNVAAAPSQSTGEVQAAHFLWNVLASGISEPQSIALRITPVGADGEGVGPVIEGLAIELGDPEIGDTLEVRVLPRSRILTPGDDRYNNTMTVLFRDPSTALANPAQSLRVYTISGKEVATVSTVDTLQDATQSARVWHRITWNGKGDGEVDLPAGLYVFVLEYDNELFKGTVAIAR